ncbi:hypothetical protein CPB86DRAFT_781447 [Serendipita vermifera]|nr:hypothetical protein CPB86DRAFT_781447 [Serendipita vermifera]
MRVHLKREGLIPEDDKIHCPVQGCSYSETRQEHANLRDHLFRGHKLRQCPQCGEEHGRKDMLEHLTNQNSVCKVKLRSIEKGGVIAA